MKLSAGKIFNAVPILKFLAQPLPRLPVRGGYGVAKNLLNFEPEFKIINDKMLEVYKEYGKEVTENSGNYLLNPETKDEAIKKLDELSTIETEVPVHMITLDELGPDVRLSCQEILFIDFMLTEKV